MRPDARERLEHVVDAGESILEFTREKSFDDYHRDRMLRSAVEREFTIIGEALREATRSDASIEPKITEFRRVIDFRNVLVHDYMVIFDEGVWLVIVTKLPILLAEVRALLADPDPTGQIPA